MNAIIHLSADIQWGLSCRCRVVVVRSLVHQLPITVAYFSSSLTRLLVRRLGRVLADDSAALLKSFFRKRRAEAKSKKQNGALGTESRAYATYGGASAPSTSNAARPPNLQQPLGATVAGRKGSGRSGSGTSDSGSSTSDSGELPYVPGVARRMPPMPPSFLLANSRFLSFCPVSLFFSPPWSQRLRGATQLRVTSSPHLLFCTRIPL